MSPKYTHISLTFHTIFPMWVNISNIHFFCILHSSGVMRLASFLSYPDHPLHHSVSSQTDLGWKFSFAVLAGHLPSFILLQSPHSFFFSLHTGCAYIFQVKLTSLSVFSHFDIMSVSQLLFLFLEMFNPITSKSLVRPPSLVFLLD